MVFFAHLPRWRALLKLGRVLTATGWVLVTLAAPDTAIARRSAAEVTAPGLVDGTVGLSSLPVQAQSTYRAILAGGPFGSSRDGIVFGNFERVLPREPRGYYHEYTVATPGAHNRGARRIVCGGNPPTRPSACYYTGDHYSHFQQIAP